MLMSSILIAVLSIVFFLVCRFVIYRRPITAEDANKVFFLAISFIFLVLAIFEIFKLKE